MSKPAPSTASAVGSFLASAATIILDAPTVTRISVIDDEIAKLQEERATLEQKLIRKL